MEDRRRGNKFPSLGNSDKNSAVGGNNLANSFIGARRNSTETKPLPRANEDRRLDSGQMDGAANHAPISDTCGGANLISTLYTAQV